MNAYLRGVDRDEITDFELDPFSVDSTRHRGTAVAGAARVAVLLGGVRHGRRRAGDRVARGGGRLVGRRHERRRLAGVATDVSVGAKLGFVLWLGIGILAVGAVLLAAGLLAIVLGRRRPPAARPAPAGRLVEGVA